LPHKKRLPLIQAIPHIEPADTGGVLYAARVSESSVGFTDTLATMQTEIIIRSHASVMDRVLDHCTYEHVSPDGDVHYIVRFPFIENDYYYNILFSLGDKCECLEPLRIRAEMKRRIQDIAALYESQAIYGSLIVTRY
jgi:predicted DNA-binding transcriptional regulator YafY